MPDNENADINADNFISALYRTNRYNAGMFEELFA